MSACVVALAIVLSFAFVAGLFGRRWRKELLQCRQELGNLRTLYAPIIDVEAELGSVRERLENTKREQEDFLSAAEQNRAKLQEQYTQALATYSNLEREISLLEENLEDISFGLYKPHFSFQTPDEYKIKLEEIRARERCMIRAGGACVCRVAWTVSGNKEKGAKMAKQHTKLLLRAFNAECDAAIANVSWSNVTKMEERIRKSFEAINQLGTVLCAFITEPYLDVKLDALRLTHEYEDARYREKEEQRRIREGMREEERAQREFEKATEDAEQEETRYQKALEKARAEAGAATGKQLEQLSRQIEALQARVEEAHQNKERAVARAQLTKSGFVYIISNIGAFGDRIYKIGMTRRLEPMDRVYELGDASVPFPFDVHAMMFSMNAPELETAIHTYLESKRVNLVNPRREFYYDVDLDDVERFVHEKGFSAQFIKLPEAREYRESLSIREQRFAAQKTQRTEKGFPNDLFTEVPKAAVSTAQAS
jgi:predicted  nucleic acid-binding Zn-ribbon protein